MASDHARTPHRLDDVDAAADALLARIDGPLRRLDRLLKPRMAGLLVPLPAHAFSGLLLILMTFAVVGFGLGLPRYLAASRKPDVWGRR